MSNNNLSGPPDMWAIPTLPFNRLRFYPRLPTIWEETEDELEMIELDSDVIAVARKLTKEWFQRLKKTKKAKK